MTIKNKITSSKIEKYYKDLNQNKIGDCNDYKK